MSNLIRPSPHFTSIIHRSSTTLSSSASFLPLPQSHCQFHLPFLPIPQPLAFAPFRSRRNRRPLPLRAFDSDSDSSSSDPKSQEEEGAVNINNEGVVGAGVSEEDYPSGEFEYEAITGLRGFLVKLKMLVAFPWERVRKGSVLTIKLRGQISDQVKTRFSPGLSLPQICENFLKAAYDPRISGIYLHIDSLNCGWGKVEEIRRHILNFKQSGKFVVAYVPTCQEKEYYLACACEEIYAPPSAYFSLFGLTVQASFLRGVLDNIGIEPQVERIGKYKSAGDQLARRTMSEENCEMLTSLLDNIYTNWLDKVSSAKGKKREDVENFINEGIYQVDKLKEEGFISNIIYDDEVMSMLKERLGVKKDKNLPMVDYRKYSRVRKWTVGISGGKDLIAIIRGSGSISRIESQLSVSSSGIFAEKFIEKIRSVRECGEKSVFWLLQNQSLLRWLTWQQVEGTTWQWELKLLLQKALPYQLELSQIGFNKETISRGRYAELLAAEERPFRPDEAELFAKSAQNAYKQFRDKAALSRSMTVDKMEEVAQGRVWTGKDAASRGLVDAIGGLSRAIAIAKLKANIPQDKEVTVVEISRPSPSLPEILLGVGNSLIGADKTLKELLQGLTVSNGVQARMDGIVFQTLEGYPLANPILSILKDYLSSL